MTQPAEICFRPATRADLPALVALLATDPLGREREDPSTPLDERYVRAFEAIDGDPNQELVVGDDGGDVAATMQLTFVPGLSRLGTLRCQVEAVRVAASRRGGGLGRRLLAHALERARARGCALVQLTSDRTRVDAHAFYRELGFVDSHVGFKLAVELESEPRP